MRWTLTDSAASTFLMQTMFVTVSPYTLPTLIQYLEARAQYGAQRRAQYGCNQARSLGARHLPKPTMVDKRKICHCSARCGRPLGERQRLRHYKKARKDGLFTMRDSESIASDSDPECEEDNEDTESTTEATGGQNRDRSTDEDISDGYISNSSSLPPDVLEGTLNDESEWGYVSEEEMVDFHSLSDEEINDLLEAEVKGAIDDILYDRGACASHPTIQYTDTTTDR